MVSSNRIFLLGEALIDLIQESDGRYSACLGGSVFNVGLALARLALAPCYLNRIALDRWGESFRASARQEGILESPLGCSACTTSLAVVGVSESGQPTYTFYREAVADRDWTPEEVLAAVQPQPGDLLHTGGLALMPEDWPKLKTVIQAWRAVGGRVSIDLNVRMVAARNAEAYQRAVMDAALQADLLKVSDEDLVALGLLHPQASADEACEAWRRWLSTTGASPSLAILTRGAEQGWCLIPGSLALGFQPPVVAQPVDTVGAGDSFWAAVLAGLARLGLLREGSPSPAQAQSILGLACRAAAHTISRRGCDPIRATDLFEESRS
ncbi:MAG: hypothetical protein RLY30_1795 [Pseudomonadota bacterium]